MPKISNAEKARLDKIKTSRDDEIYKRIESYPKEEFLNNIIFEYHLRLKKFYKLFNQCKDELLKIKDNITDLDINKDNSQLQHIYLQYKDKFASYNYDIIEILLYIYYTFPDSKIHREQKIVSEKAILMEMQLKHKFQMQSDDPNLSNKLNQIKAHSYKFHLPKFHTKNESMYLQLNPFDDTNSLLMQVEKIINEISPQTNTKKDKDLDRKHKNNIRDLIGHYNINKSYADMFYIYDNYSIGLPISSIKKEIDNYRTSYDNQAKSISVNTITSHFEVIKEHLKNNFFTTLTY